jgi:hypothetical protein
MIRTSFDFRLPTSYKNPTTTTTRRRAAVPLWTTTMTNSLGKKLIQTVIHRRSYRSDNMKLEFFFSPRQKLNQRFRPILFRPAETPSGLTSWISNHHQISFNRGYVNTTSSDFIDGPTTDPFKVSNSLNRIAATETNSNENQAIAFSTGAGSKSNGNGDLMDTYAVAIITSSDTDGNMKLSTKNLSIQQIVKEVIPGTHPRDFFSLALTSLGDASRKRKILMKTHYSLKNTINPWFILPRETEIVVSGSVQTFLILTLPVVMLVFNPTRLFIISFRFFLLCWVRTKDVFWLRTCNYREEISVHF